MRRMVLNLSLLSLLAAPVVAHAASLDEITLTQIGDSADTYSFIVPTSSLVTSANTDGATYFTLFDVTVDSPGTVFDPGAVSSSTEEVTFFDAAFGAGGGLLDNNLVTEALNITFYEATFFSSLTAAGGGSYTATFAPVASGTAAGYDQSGDPASFDYSISTYLAPSATPEPSSLMLLGTGALGVFGAFRRRVMA
jgi:hypothetical protein